MLRKMRNAALLICAAWIAVYAGPGESKGRPDLSWLWIAPAHIESRDLIYGMGSADRRPAAAEYTFVEEDTDGVNPKYLVKDAAGVEWKVKLGREAQPEIAASRLMWAAGFYTNEDYFLPSLRIANLPEKVRGKNLIGPGGAITNARLRRIREKEKKVGYWKWDESPYRGTREFNGLRTMMAVLNNWDLKDANTAIVDNHNAEPGRPVRMYMASDLGSSFGSTIIEWNQGHVKGNVDEYTTSAFVTAATPQLVSFKVPGDFRLNGTFVQYLYRRPRQWITRDIPRQDAKWMGDVLGGLSPKQIRDAFQAAGYSVVEADLFARVVERRIAALREL